MNKVAALMVLSLVGAGLAAQTTKSVVAPLAPVGDRKAAADFDLLDANGKTVRLTDYRGRVVLLDFWATNCGGCVEEIPMFIEIAKDYKRQGLTAIGVSEDIPYSTLSGPTEAWARVKPFVRDHKVGYPVLMGDDRVMAAYNIKALPLTYLIDRKGLIAAAYQGVVDHDSLMTNINALLAERR